MKQGYCSNCGCTYNIKPSFSGKLIAAGVSGMIAPQMAKNPLVALLIFVGSIVVGHYIDKEIEKECPACGVALQLLSSI